MLPLLPWDHLLSEKWNHAALASRSTGQEYYTIDYMRQPRQGLLLFLSLNLYKLNYRIGQIRQEGEMILEKR